MVLPSLPLPVFALQSLSSALPVDFFVLSSLQPSCPKTTALLGNPSLRVVSIPYGESSVLCDLSTGSPQPLVPVSLRRQVFLTLVFVLPRDWFREHLSGLAFPRMSPTGPEVVFIVKGVKFSNIFTHLFLRFLFLLDISVTIM